MTPDSSTGSSSLPEVPGGSVISDLQEVDWTGTRSVYLQVSERPQTEENICSTSRLSGPPAPWWQ